MNTFSKKDTIALYVHWPWCLKKCPYCDFNSHVAKSDETDAYVDALIADMQKQAQNVTPRTLISIFFGGGTPSLMRSDQVKRVLDASKALFKWSKDIEITLESNPTSSNIDKFKAFKAVGINRLSIGVQSLHDDYLKFLGREHSAKDALKTVEEANMIFDNVNIDFIYGLPNQDLNLWKSDLETICKLGTTHVSAYQLTIEPNTAFFGQVKKNKWSPLDDDCQADFYDLTKSTLKSHNIEQYEISNFSRDMHNCKHNTHIWEYGDYIGIGAGAHGRYLNLNKQRIFVRNYKQPNTYTDSVKHVEHKPYSCEIIDSAKESTERLLTGLRLIGGVHLNEQIMENINIQSLERLIALNLVHKEHSQLCVSEQALPLLDSILSDLIS